MPEQGQLLQISPFQDKCSGFDTLGPEPSFVRASLQAWSRTGGEIFFLPRHRFARTFDRKVWDSAKSSWVAPRFEHAINGLTNGVTGVSPAVAAHKKLIVSRVTMADGRNHSGSKGAFLERPPGECPPHPATAPPGSVCRDRSRLLRRTPGEQSRDHTGHTLDEVAIIFDTAHFVPFALSRALLTIREAFLFGALDRSLRNQDALTFVAAT